MTVAVPLRLAARIASETGAGLGRIGAFATDQDGNCYALGARHVIDSEASEVIYSKGDRIGLRCDVDLDPVADFSELVMSDAIGAVHLDDYTTQVSAEINGIPIFGIIEDVVPLIGEPAFCLLTEKTPIPCIVTGVGLSVFLRNGDSTVVKYRGAVEVIFDDGKMTPVKGDAGAPVVDSKGNLIGLIISSARSRFFVSPLHEYLKRAKFTANFGYRLETKATISPSKIPIINATFRAVGEGLAEWANGLRVTRAEGSPIYVDEEQSMDA